MTATQYFQRYSQRENVVTNNVLMLLQRIHDLRPRKFEAILSGLLQCGSPDALSLDVGPRFRQQVPGPERVADGLVSQQGFDLLIETKLASEFDIDQAIGHLAQLRQSANPILLLLGTNPNAEDSRLKPVFDAARSKKLGSSVRVVVCGFKDLIEECRGAIPEHDEQLHEVVDDFESFCLETKLLSEDDHILFVPPCGESFEENVRWGLYYCLATRSRRSGRWLGVYKDKSVRAVGRIELVLEVSSGDSGFVLTPGANEEQRVRILGAIADARKRGWDLLEEPHTFYVCSDMAETAFDKDSRGGIAGHRYFDLRRLRLPNDTSLSSEAIASELHNHRWSEWGQS